MTSVREAAVAPAVGDSAAPLLDVRGVSAGYRGRPVLHDVGLRVEPGEIVGVVGPNGGGKSTLVRVVSGLLRPSAGEVLLGGRAVTELSAREIACFAGVVPQGAALPEEFTGLEIVLLGRTPHLRLLQSESARDYAIAGQALARCDAAHLGERRVRQMSGGERQRLLIARALAQEPRLLLLDEPTTHLDITHQAAVFGLVTARCRAEGLGALAVVHDLTLAAQVCDRLVLMVAGAVRAEGTPAEVLRPETLSAAFGGRVSVVPHPESGRPVVVPVAGGIEYAEFLPGRVE